MAQCVAGAVMHAGPALTRLRVDVTHAGSVDHGDGRNPRPKRICKAEQECTHAKPATTGSSDMLPVKPRSAGICLCEGRQAVQAGIFAYAHAMYQAAACWLSCRRWLAMAPLMSRLGTRRGCGRGACVTGEVCCLCSQAVMAIRS